MTDADMDFILERFDETEPDLQRRIVARLAVDRFRLLDACKAALALCERGEAWQAGEMLRLAVHQAQTRNGA